MTRRASPSTPPSARPPETLAERFWSLARGMDDASPDDPKAVVRHVLAVLDQLEAGEVGDDVTVNTLSFLHLLRQQEMKGDLLYASPEQVRGEQMDERSLVFSVGVLLFEKLTGRHPFGAEGNPNRIARIRKGELASGVNFFPKVPSALRTVLVKAMGPFPEERYRTLSELRAVLEAYVADDFEDSVQLVAPREGKLPAMRESEDSIDAMWSRSIQKREPAFKAKVEKPPRIGGFLWAFAGAAVASIAFLIIGSQTSPKTAAPPPAAEPASDPKPVPVATPMPEPEAETAEAPGAEPAVAEPEPETPEEAPQPAAATFDADVGAEAALAAAKTCFTEERLAGGLQFGASLVYTKKDGLSHKVYWGAAGGLTGAEKACVSDELTGISAGAPPDRNTVVVHSFFLSPSGSRVTANVKEPLQ